MKCQLMIEEGCLGEEGKVRGVLMVDEMDMGKEGFLEELGIVFKLEMD